MGWLSGSRTRTRVSQEERKKTQYLTYLESLQIFEGNKDLGGLETGQTMQTAEGKPPSMTDVSLNTLQHALTMGFGGGTTQRSNKVEDSGWTIKSQEKVTQWDKIRYGIGIKEIGAYAYQFVERSGFVSVPFKTPKPIRSVSLHVDEIIPTVFNKDVVQPWIKYWIAFADSDQWTSIAPANTGAANLLDARRAPQTIHVNTGIPEQERDARAGYADLSTEVNQVRLKAILERPAGRVDMTPVLKGYRLRIVLRGGL